MAVKPWLRKLIQAFLTADQGGMPRNLWMEIYFAWKVWSGG